MNKKGDNQKNQRIQVFARCRPLNSIEKKQNSPSVVDVIPEKKEILLKDRNANREFFFDKVFPPDTKQIAVYKAVVGPLIQEVLNGYNCTVFAYGQTGTGKTYTMEGERNNSSCSWEDDPGAGIIPRSLHQLFEELNKEENVEFSVRVSFLELYNEELFDLLSSTDFSKLRLYEDTNRKGSVIIHGLEEILVNNKDEVYTILEKGTARRQTAATMLNATSSRSHTVFSVTVHIKENTLDGEELLKTGKLNLVDLAGSENVGRSGAIDKRAREAGNINQSLLTLGRVITALIEKQPHVPYRESKLTRLLQDSLGGHTKTSIIATISPAFCNFDETISTLDYATKAKSITIKPEVNQKMTKRALIREYTEEIERLRKDLAASRSNQGFFIDADNYAALVSKSTLQENTNKELTDKIETLTAEVAKIELLFTTTKEELGKTHEQFLETSQKYSETKEVLHHTQEVLSKTTLERDEKQYLINIQANTEKQLTHQAKTLLQVADQTTDDVHKLHSKIERKQNVEKTNEELCREFQLMSRKQCSNLYGMVTNNAKEEIKYLHAIKEDQDCMKTFINESKQKKTNFLETFTSELQSLCDGLISQLNDQTDNQIQQNNDLSEDINSKKDHLLAQYETYKAEKLPALINKLNIELTTMEECYLNSHQNVAEKIQQRTAALEAQVAEQKSALWNLKNTLESYFIKNEAAMLEYNKQIHSLSETRDKMRTIISLCTDVQANIDKTMQIEDTCRFENNGQELKKVKVPLDRLDNSILEFGNEVTQCKDIPKTINHQEFSKKKESIQQIHLDVSSDFTSFLEDSSKLQVENYQEVKASFDNYNFEALEHMQHNKSTINGIITSLLSKTEDNNKWLVEQDERLKNVMAHSRDVVKESEKTSTQVESCLKQEILKVDQEIEKFISEDLVKDIPTGTTPQRKSYVYPKFLSATSPHERILQRFRSQLSADTAAALNTPLDNSFNESDESKNTSGEMGSAVSSHNTSFISDVYESDGCETDSSAVSDISVDGKNKENLKKNKKKSSKLPKKAPKFKGFAVPAPIVGRKPLLSSNPDTNSTS
ncbi:hypothetical protein JTE90_026321 [Oedothorax gibbosus]|uniref:Kinesin motor domain-containing protein n=1 Tax=Oedothorax gibbosus TaxID=931172 RepID=A0AAV6U529_9ARAC|nr:hypothetical protein JTE90_026321 [Oedothorax gibbosus]